MQWQEQLRELDAKLASGELNQAEHRRRRDEVLAEASGAQTGSAKLESVLSQQQSRPGADRQPQAAALDGNAVFSQAAPRKRRVAPILVIVLLALAATTMWLLLTRPSGNDPAPAATTPVATIADRLPKPPGTVVVPAAVLPTAVGFQLGLYPTTTARASGVPATGLANTVSTDGATTISLNLLDGGDTDRTAEVLAYATKTGWTPAPSSDPKITVVSPGGRATPVYRAIYPSGKLTVIITVAGPDPQARAGLDAVLKATVERLPAG